MINKEIEYLYVRNKLSNSMISSYILSPISGGDAPPEALVRTLGIESEVSKIFQIYDHYASKIADASIDTRPRFLPFYQYIQENFADFRWREELKDGQVITLIEKPYIHNKKPTLLELIIACLRGQSATMPKIKVKYPCLNELPNEFCSELENLIQHFSISSISTPHMESFVKAIEASNTGKPLDIISPVCPDYSYITIGDKYQYTFNSLGDGIGLVASRIVRVLPSFSDVFSRFDINHRTVIAAGDFEALDKTTIDSVGESYSSFVEKVDISQGKIVNAIDRSTSSLSITSLAGGPSHWLALVEESAAMLKLGDFGGIVQSQVDFEAIFQSRLALYRAWHKGKGDSELRDILYNQAAEYAVMGKLFMEHYDNPMVIGADHNKMMPFYWLHGQFPVMYLKRVY
ncbi:hypothetical protein [Teredinibacter purpureus]|uniref:hypothetical protein n=1 Tax=Teredinibacter purpureus TaxID=2731756 RepID=UPI0005F7C391|nr:hypothetical protein [Teredinibacter purpureus]